MRWIIGLVIKATVGTVIGRSVTHYWNNRTRSPFDPQDEGPQFKDHGHRKVPLWDYLRK